MGSGKERGIPAIDVATLEARVIERNRLRQARWATSGIFLLLGTVLGSWVARIPAVQDRLRLDDGQLGIALLSVSFGAILAMPTTGWLIKQWGNSRIMRTAAAVVCLLLPFLPLAPTMPLLMLVLFIFGMCFGVLDVSMNVQAVAIEERHGLPIMSTFHGVFSIGGLVGAAVAGVAAGLGVAPFPHFLAVAVVLMILQLVAGRYLLETRARQSDAPVFAVPPRSLLALGLLSFCVLLGEGAMADWSAVYMQDTLGASAAIAAAGYAGFSLAMAAMRFAGDALTITLGPVRMVRLGGLIAGLALAGAIAIGTIPAALVGFTCVGIGLAASFPIALGAAGRTPGMAPGAAIGAVSTAGYTGLLIGPPVIGFISELTELRVSLLLVAALALATALLGGTVRRLG